jgi:serine/threonine-protein kinase RsbT
MGDVLFEGRLIIDSEASVVAVRRAIREAATSLGFGLADVTRVVTAASELARNVFFHARNGHVRWRTVGREYAVGIEIVFEDEGPGIPDIDQALTEGWSTSGNPGIGLPGSRRLTDEMELRSTPGQGTVVTVRKWRR